MWSRLGHEGIIDYEPWPTYDPQALLSDTVQMAVSVNGKTRDVLSFPREASQEEATRIAFASPKVAPFLEGKAIKKTIYVPGRILNFVVGA